LKFLSGDNISVVPVMSNIAANFLIPDNPLLKYYRLSGHKQI
jgi:hypothetical protein